jgi:uncharacterized LabA/DUF88 family protein
MKPDGLMNAVVYVDYENISELIKQYGKDPLEIDFFKVTQEKIRESKLKIVDYIVYSNFERKSLNSKQQTYIRTLGLQTRHVSNHGKNSADLELTVDALQSLYKNPNLDAFVIISSDRDIIPLLKAIKYENKTSYVYSTQRGFNKVVAEYADFHYYIEDIFDLTTETLQPIHNKLPITLDDSSNINDEKIKRALEVSRFLCTSNIWKKYTRMGEPINLTGYVNVISKVINRIPDEITNDFKVAHSLKYVSIYEGQNHRLFLGQGEKYSEVITNN